MTDAKKEKPILFSGPMVRAILDGSKTQTRRVLKPQPSCPIQHSDGSWWDADNAFIHQDTPIKLPHAVDVLWVRESFALEQWLDDISPSKAPGAGVFDVDPLVWYAADDNASIYNLTNTRGRWRPSIHMPRWASRIDLAVKRVWIERLQDITWQDAIAEGIDMESDHASLCIDIASRSEENDMPDGQPELAVFRALWDSINGAPRKDGVDISWAANPGVECTEFERIEP